MAAPRPTNEPIPLHPARKDSMAAEAIWEVVHALLHAERIKTITSVRVAFHMEAERSEKGMVRMPIGDIDQLLDRIADGKAGGDVVPEPEET